MEAETEDRKGQCIHLFNVKKAISTETDRGDESTVVEVYCQYCLEVREL